MTQRPTDIVAGRIEWPDQVLELLLEMGLGGRTVYVPKRIRDKKLEQEIRQLLTRMEELYETTGEIFMGPGGVHRRDCELKVSEAASVLGCSRKTTRRSRPKAQKKWEQWFTGSEKHRLDSLKLETREFSEGGIALIYRTCRSIARAGDDPLIHLNGSDLGMQLNTRLKGLLAKMALDSVETMQKIKNPYGRDEKMKKDGLPL